MEFVWLEKSSTSFWENVRVLSTCAGDGTVGEGLSAKEARTLFRKGVVWEGTEETWVAGDASGWMAYLRERSGANS
jgi:hypothetical protein